jgi:hypothetical protein
LNGLSRLWMVQADKPRHGHGALGGTEFRFGTANCRFT